MRTTWGDRSSTLRRVMRRTLHDSILYGRPLRVVMSYHENKAIRRDAKLLRRQWQGDKSDPTWPIKFKMLLIDTRLEDLVKTACDSGFELNVCLMDKTGPSVDRLK